MANKTQLPAWFVEAGVRLGLQGKRIRFPEVVPRGDTETLRWLLRRAEDRVLEVRDASPVVIRSAWGKMRGVARTIGVAVSTVHEAMPAARLEIARWWKRGEADRVSQVQRLRDPVGAMREYLRVRRRLRGATNPQDGSRAMDGVTRPGVARLAAISVSECWWWHDTERRAAWMPDDLMVELGTLLVVTAAHGISTVEMATQAHGALAAVGVPEGNAVPMVKAMERVIPKARGIIGKSVAA